MKEILEQLKELTRRVELLEAKQDAPTQIDGHIILPPETAIETMQIINRFAPKYPFKKKSVLGA